MANLSQCPTCPRSVLSITVKPSTILETGRRCNPIPPFTRSCSRPSQISNSLPRVRTTQNEVFNLVLVFHLLDGTGIGIKEIFAVYNPMLVSTLGLTKEKFNQRAVKSADVFLKEKWRDMDESERRRAKREWTKAYLSKKIALFNWNVGEAVPVLATIHGTAGNAAWKICCGGFAALSSLDSGYYSAGIYFTTSAKYAVPVCPFFRPSLTSFSTSPLSLSLPLLSLGS